MLDTYHRLATLVHRVRWLLWTLAIGACVAFGIGLFRTPGSAYFLGALVVLMWSLLMLAMAQSFAQPAPVVEAQDGWLARLKARFWRGYLWLLAIATTVLGAFVVFISIRAITIIARGSGG